MLLVLAALPGSGESDYERVRKARGEYVELDKKAQQVEVYINTLDAELVAISGAYVMADEIPAERRGKPSQIYLDGGECRIVPL